MLVYQGSHRMAELRQELESEILFGLCGRMSEINQGSHKQVVKNTQYATAWEVWKNHSTQCYLSLWPTLRPPSSLWRFWCPKSLECQDIHSNMGKILCLKTPTKIKLYNTWKWYSPLYNYCQALDKDIWYYPGGILVQRILPRKASLPGSRMPNSTEYSIPLALKSLLGCKTLVARANVKT